MQLLLSWNDVTYIFYVSGVTRHGAHSHVLPDSALFLSLRFNGHFPDGSGLAGDGIGTNFGVG